MPSVEAPPPNAPHVRFPTFEFAIVFLPVALVILTGGYMFTSMNLDARFEQLVRDDREQLFLLRGFIGAEVKGSLHHLHALADEPELIAALETDNQNDLDVLKAEFLRFANRNPQYQQVRWIDENGLERIRINRDGNALSATPEDGLQDKSARYYVQRTTDLLHGEVYVSPVDLNIEHGQVELPLRPVMRVATPVFDRSRNRRGSLVLNLSLRDLFRVAENGYRREGSGNFLLLNGQGTLLNDTDPQADEQSVRFAQAHPSVWNVISSRDAGHLEEDDGFWTWQKISSLGPFNFDSTFAPIDSKPLRQIARDDFSLILVARQPQVALMGIRRDSRFVGSLASILAVTVFGFALYLYLSGHVRAQRGQLVAATAMVRAARVEKEREFEKRFHALVEASSIGQLVVDGAGTITITNRAIETLLGYAPEDLVGKSIEKLVAADLRDRHTTLRNEYLKSPEARKMGNGRVFSALHKDGSRVRVEVGLNPYTEDGQQRVLVNVVDVSPR